VPCLVLVGLMVIWSSVKLRLKSLSGGGGVGEGPGGGGDGEPVEEGVEVVAANAEPDAAVTKHAAPPTEDRALEANSGDGIGMAHEAKDGRAEPKEEPDS
jgi:hypothetical protein